MADVASLNQQAAHLREQAQKMHDAGNNATRAARSDIAQRVESAQRDAAKARAEQQLAEKQANDERGFADLHRSQADKLDADAAGIAATDPKKAEEMREDAATHRASAVSAQDTAEKADQAAAAAKAEADASDADAARTLSEMDQSQQPSLKMEAVADDLDRKAAYLEDAARMERKAIDAESSGDKVTAQEQRDLVADALKRADMIKPDVSGIDPQDLRDAGVDLSEAPGTELMDPSASAAMADPGSSIDALDDAIRTPPPDADSAGDTQLTDDIHDLTAPMNETNVDTPMTDAGYQLGAEAMQPDTQPDLQTPDASSLDDSSSLTAEPTPAAADYETESYTPPETQSNAETDADADADAGAEPDPEFAE